MLGFRKFKEISKKTYEMEKNYGTITRFFYYCDYQIDRVLKVAYKPIAY